MFFCRGGRQSRPKSTFILLVILLGAGYFYIRYYNSDQQNQRDGSLFEGRESGFGGGGRAPEPPLEIGKRPGDLGLERKVAAVKETVKEPAKYISGRYNRICRTPPGNVPYLATTCSLYLDKRKIYFFLVNLFYCTNEWKSGGRILKGILNIANALNWSWWL